MTLSWKEYYALSLLPFAFFVPLILTSDPTFWFLAATAYLFIWPIFWFRYKGQPTHLRLRLTIAGILFALGIQFIEAFCMANSVLH